VAATKTAKPARVKADKAETSEKDGKTLKATLRKSSIGAIPSVKATIVSLGFRKMNQTRELPDNPAVRGMLKAVDFLVAVEGEPYLRPDRSRYKIWRSRSNKKHQRGN
jgi:large subunit ribosomal protein L30